MYTVPICYYQYITFWRLSPGKVVRYGSYLAHFKWNDPAVDSSWKFELAGNALT